MPPVSPLEFLVSRIKTSSESKLMEKGIFTNSESSNKQKVGLDYEKENKLNPNFPTKKINIYGTKELTKNK